jgi:hypothetical protein
MPKELHVADQSGGTVQINQSQELDQPDFPKLAHDENSLVLLIVEAAVEILAKSRVFLPFLMKEYELASGGVRPSQNKCVGLEGNVIAVYIGR